MSRPERVEAKQNVAPLRADIPVTAEPPAKKTGRKKAILGVIALAVLGAAGYFGHEYWTVGRFMVETDDAYVASDITLISSRVQGYVADLPVADNQHVAAGDVLMRLEDGDYVNALAMARSRVETAGQTLKRIEAQTNAARAGVSQAIAAVDAARSQLHTAQLTADRIKTLTTSNVAAKAQLDDAENALATAQAGVASALAGVQSAQAQVHVLEAQFAEAEGTRKELQIAVRQAERNLEMTVLRAPVAGIVANSAIKLGDLVAPGARLAAVVADDGFHIDANYKETQLAGVTVGAPVHVTFDALPDREFTGTVASVAPATGSVFSLLPADNATGNFTKVVQRVPVRIDLPADVIASNHLRAGLSAVVAVDSRGK